MFYNIGKKKEVNPFAEVKGVVFADGSVSDHLAKLKKFVHENEVPKAEAYGHAWHLVFPIESLNFTTLLNFFDLSISRGKFSYKGGVIHFRLENDLIILF